VRFGTCEFQESVQVRLIENGINIISKVKLGILGERGSDGNKGSTEPAKDYILSYGNVNDNYCLWRGFTMHKPDQICS
jgi:hypothetical protein